MTQIACYSKAYKIKKYFKMYIVAQPDPRREWLWFCGVCHALWSCSQYIAFYPLHCVSKTLMKKKCTTAMFNRNELYNGVFPMAISEGRTSTHGVNMNKKTLL